jgi:hypothetical protein
MYVNSFCNTGLPLTCTSGVAANVHVQAEQQANREFYVLAS